MAKGQTQQATAGAGKLGAGSAGTTQSALTGQPVAGAGVQQPFGPQGLTAERQSNVAQAQESRDVALGGIKTAQQTGGYDPAMLQTVRSNQANLALTGGYDPETLTNLAATSGYRPEIMNFLTSKGAEFTDTGGYDPSAINTFRSFSDTGGYTPKDISNYLYRGTSGLANTYRTLANQQEAQRAATGGLGGGSTTALARQLGEAQASTTTKAQADLADQIAKNRLAGATGLGQVATARETAARDLGTMEADIAAGKRGLASDVAAGRRAGVQQQADLETGVSRGVLTSDQLANTLYSTDTGKITDTGKMILSMLGIDSSNQAESLNVLTQLSKNPGLFQTAFGDFLSLMGTATGGKGTMPGGIVPTT